MPCEDRLDSRAGERDIVALCSYVPNWIQSSQTFQTFQSFNIREQLRDLSQGKPREKAEFLFVVSVEC